MIRGRLTHTRIYTSLTDAISIVEPTIGPVVRATPFQLVLGVMPVGSCSCRPIWAFGCMLALVDLSACNPAPAVPEAAGVAAISISEPHTPSQDIMSMTRIAVSLDSQGKRDGAIAADDAIVQRFSGDSSQRTVGLVAMALAGKAADLTMQKRSAEALMVTAFILQNYQDEQNPLVRKSRMKALFNQGIALAALGRNDSAVESFDRLDLTYGSNIADVSDRRLVRGALLNKGMALEALGRWLKAQETFQDLLSRPPHHETDPLMISEIDFAAGQLAVTSHHLRKK